MVSKVPPLGRGHEARTLGQGHRHREGAVEAKQIIESTAVEIFAKVSESGKLFGGISNEQIANALA